VVEDSEELMNKYLSGEEISVAAIKKELGEPLTIGDYVNIVND